MPNLRILLILAALGAQLATSVFACTNCRCRSKRDYLPDGDGGSCDDSNCNFYCVLPPQDARFTMVPGFRVDPRNVVAAVYPYSPAAQAGIRVGDVLLEVDGRAMRDLCSNDEPGDYDRTYTIQRGKERLEFKIARVPLLTLLSANALRSELASARYPSSLVMPEIPDTPYLSGLLLAPSSVGFRVRSVLSGTPAAGFGITPGEMIIGVNGQGFTGTDAGLLNSIEGSESRSQVTLRVRNADHVRDLTIRFRSVSEILDTLSNR